MRSRRRRFAWLILATSACAPPVAPPPVPHAAKPQPSAVRPAVPQPANVETVGTPHPYTLQAVGADGGWVVLCQAREDTDGDGAIDVQRGHHGATWGDRMQMYFIGGSGPGDAIDAYIGSDPTGRFVALVRDGRLELRDLKRGRTTRLAPDLDLRRDPSPAMPPRTLRFAPDGRHLLYLRSVGGRSKVTIRELESGRERTLDPGPGLLWRAEFDPAGFWLALWMVVADSNGDGALTLPVVKTTRDDDPCGSPDAYSTYGPSDDSDQPVARFVPVAGGTPRAVPDVVYPFGRTLLRRVGSGAIVSESADGKTEELVDARCRGRIRHADPERRLLVMACGALEREKAAERSKAPPKIDSVELEIFAPGARRKLRARVMERFVDEEPSRGRAAHFVTDDLGRLVLDLDTGTEHLVGAEERVMATVGSRLLLSRTGQELVFRDLATSRETPLVRREHDGPVHRAGKLVFAPPLLIDVEAGRVVGTHEPPCSTEECEHAERFGEVLANDGRLLVPVPHDPAKLPKTEILRRLQSGIETRSGAPVPLGPLTWLRPRPP